MRKLNVRKFKEIKETSQQKNHPNTAGPIALVALHGVCVCVNFSPHTRVCGSCSVTDHTSQGIADRYIIQPCAASLFNPQIGV